MKLNLWPIRAIALLIVVHFSFSNSYSQTTFTPQSFTFPALNESYAAWGDYDNDGLPDIVMIGYNGTFNSRIYHNTGSGFVEVYMNSLAKVARGSIKWGD